MFVCVFVCVLFGCVCLFGCLGVFVCVCLCARSFYLLIVCLLVCLFVCLFVSLCVFDCLFAGGVEGGGDGGPSVRYQNENPTWKRLGTSIYFC